MQPQPNPNQPESNVVEIGRCGVCAKMGRLAAPACPACVALLGESTAKLFARARKDLVYALLEWTRLNPPTRRQFLKILGNPEQKRPWGKP
jgi:hypothetical protein